MQDLAGIPLGTLTPAAIVGATVLLVLLGRLVPRRVLDDVRADRDKRETALTAEADKWRNAWREELGRSDALQAQNKELLELARTAVPVIQALPRATSDSSEAS